MFKRLKKWWRDYTSNPAYQEIVMGKSFEVGPPIDPNRPISKGFIEATRSAGYIELADRLEELRKRQLKKGRGRFDSGT